MPPMTNSQVAAIAETLGHTRVGIVRTKSGRRFIVDCACGWGAPDSGGKPTVTRATFAEAVSTGKHHIRSSVDRHLASIRANGGSPLAFLAAKA